MVEAFAHTNQNIHIIRERPADIITVWTTGIGGSQFYKDIREAFNIDNKNIAEADCFAHSFVHLVKNLARKDLLTDVYKPAFQHTQRHVARYHKMMSKMKSLSNWQSDATEDEGPPEVQYPVGYTDNQDKPLTEESGIMPCLLFACGSGFGGLKIQEDGSYALSTMSNRGGKTFCGLGSLLTGCKTFEELMELCEKGYAGKVGITNIQMIVTLNDEDEDSVYTAAKDGNMDETMLFYFGHAVGKDREHFKKEDIARCLLEMTIQDMVQVAHSACINGKFKNVFFCGSFVSHPLVRQLITKEWLYRDVVMAMFMENSEAKEQIGFHFLQQGSHLGALGAYLNSHAKFFKEPEKSGTEGSPQDTAEPAK